MNPRRHIQSTSCKHCSCILHEMNLSVSIHVPYPRHKNRPLKMTFLVGSFSKDIKGKRSHRKSTFFESLKHVTEEQRGRTGIPDGPREGNEAEMGFHKCYSCSRSQITSEKLFLDLPPHLTWSAKAIKPMTDNNPFCKYILGSLTHMGKSL